MLAPLPLWGKWSERELRLVVAARHVTAAGAAAEWTGSPAALQRWRTGLGSLITD
jgi:hypothetical protein